MADVDMPDDLYLVACVAARAEGVSVPEWVADAIRAHATRAVAPVSLAELDLDDEPLPDDSLFAVPPLASDRVPHRRRSMNELRVALAVGIATGEIAPGADGEKVRRYLRINRTTARRLRDEFADAARWSA